MDTITNFEELMFLKNMSKKTIKTYVDIVKYVSKNRNKHPEEINESDIRSYLISRKDLSSSSRMMVINAFKSYFKLCLDRDFDHKILPRPKVEQKQPDILSIEEFQAIIDHLCNLKHRTIVALMYSCGLRVGEVLSLRITDIDSKNNKINIRNPKGKVDRIVMLDDNLLQLLRNYWNTYKTSEYLFEGQTGNRYSEKSVQNIIKNTVKKLGFTKKISPHSLRHSCFTQMIKDGVDIRTIQKIAGHKNINTTANYLKIIDVDVLSTKSPLNNIKI